MAPMAEPSPYTNGPPLGPPIPAHDNTLSSNGVSGKPGYGANPGPGWSNCKSLDHGNVMMMLYNNFIGQL